MLRRIMRNFLPGLQKMKKNITLNTYLLQKKILKMILKPNLETLDKLVDIKKLKINRRRCNNEEKIL